MCLWIASCTKDMNVQEALWTDARVTRRQGGGSDSVVDMMVRSIPQRLFSFRAPVALPILITTLAAMETEVSPPLVLVPIHCKVAVKRRC